MSEPTGVEGSPKAKHTINSASCDSEFATLASQRNAVQEALFRLCKLDLPDWDRHPNVVRLLRIFGSDNPVQAEAIHSALQDAELLLQISGSTTSSSQNHISDKKKKGKKKKR